MAYQDDEVSAAEELDSAPEEASESSDHTFFLPPDCVSALEKMGVRLEPGAKLPFVVTGKDKDGNVEIGYEKSDDKDDWGKDLENSMPASVGGNMEE